MYSPGWQWFLEEPGLHWDFTQISWKEGAVPKTSCVIIGC